MPPSERGGGNASFAVGAKQCEFLVQTTEWKSRKESRSEVGKLEFSEAIVFLLCGFDR